MAAELAGALAVGGDCPVCGSAEHPHLASARTGAPDAAAEKAARKLVDDAESARLAHDGLVRDLLTRIAVAQEQAAGEGDPAAELPAAEAELERLSTVAGDLIGAAARDRAGRDRPRRAQPRRARRCCSSSGHVRAGLDAQQAEAQAIARELADVLGGTGHSSRWPTWPRTTAAWPPPASRRTSAWRDAAHAAEAEAEAHRAEEAAATEAGFADLASALDAALDADELTASRPGSATTSRHWPPPRRCSPTRRCAPPPR